MKKYLISLIILYSTFSSAFAEELKGQSTNLHVSSYGSGNKVNTKLEVGKTAPDFSSKDSQGKVVSLSSFKGKKSVLLVFYPGDETPVCTKQLSDIRDNFKGLEKLDVKVFGINPADADSHKKFIKNNKFPFELLVDTDNKVINLYDAMGSLGFVNRTVVLINKQGKIVLYKRGVPDVSPKAITSLL